MYFVMYLDKNAKVVIKAKNEYRIDQAKCTNYWKYKIKESQKGSSIPLRNL